MPYFAKKNRGQISPSSIHQPRGCQAAISSVCCSVCTSVSGCPSSVAFASCFAFSCTERTANFFFDAQVSLLVNLIVSVLDVCQLVGHVLLGKIEQEGCGGIAARCVLEIGNQEIPADNSFLLGGKIGDDVHLVLVLKVVVGFFCLYTHSLKMFLAKKWEHEEINHPVLVCAKLGFRHIDLQDLLFGILYGLFLRNLLVALVLFLQLFQSGKRLFL